jgi:hypothetical protein
MKNRSLPSLLSPTLQSGAGNDKWHEPPKKEATALALKSIIGFAVFFCGSPLMDSCYGQSTPAIDLQPVSFSSLFEILQTDGLYGWSFRVNSPITIRGLAWLDEGLDGLNHSHTISLWKDQSGATNWSFFGTENALYLNSVEIPSGTNAPLDGSWRRIDFNVALTLEPGGYAVMGIYQPDQEDPFLFTQVPYPSSVIDSRIQIGAPMATYGLDFTNPFITSAYLVNGAILGPNLFIEQVPEPSTILLVMLGAGFFLKRL